MLYHCLLFHNCFFSSSRSFSSFSLFFFFSTYIHTVFLCTIVVSIRCDASLFCIVSHNLLLAYVGFFLFFFFSYIYSTQFLPSRIHIHKHADRIMRVVGIKKNHKKGRRISFCSGFFFCCIFNVCLFVCV